MQLADLEYRHLAGEISKVLAGSKVGKIYQITESLFKLQFTARGDKQTLLVQLPEYLTLTARDVPSPQQPSNFVMALRKRIENSVVISVTQPEMERIIFIDLDCKGQRCRLILEMFSSGNIIFCLTDGTIDLIYRKESWRDRELKKGVIYKLPPTKVSPLSATPNMVSLNGKTTLMSGILSLVSLSPKYLEEALQRAGLDPKSKAEPTDAQRKKVVECMHEVCGESKFIAYMDGEKPQDYAVCSLSKYVHLAERKFESACALVDFAYEPNLMLQEHKEQEESHKKQEVASAKMRERLAELDAEASESKTAGDKIYENYGEIELLLETARNAVKKTKNEKEINELLGKVWPGAAISMKDHTVKIKIDR